MKKTTLAFASVALAAACLWPSAARANTARCPAQHGGPRCHLSYGKATFIDDGDTIDVDIAGDGTHISRRVRFTGINAMELRRYSKYARRRRGACHAVSAADLVQRLVHRAHRHVRLAARRPGSHAGKRLRREISVRIRGHWIDLGSTEVRAGLALWMPSHREWAWNHKYERLAKQARAAGRGIYNPRACHGGGRPLLMHLRYDAPHNDARHINGEWARIRNPWPHKIHIGHWTFRDSALRDFRFPRRAVIRAHGSVLVRMGHGRNRRRVFHWGLGSPPLENPTHDRRWLGDGGYLFDRHGNIRASEIYP